MQVNGLSRRILARLEQAELREPNPHFRDDYRIAWITVLNAWQGSLCPQVAATYAVLGVHPEKVWPLIVGWRKAKLGSEYAEWCDAMGNLRPQISAWQALPKKPVQMELRFTPLSIKAKAA